MKTHYVKTSNYQNFLAGVNKVKQSSSHGSKILELTGVPGSGKSRCVDHYGSHHHAIYIEGMPEMSLSYIRDNIAHELGVSALKGFALQKSINEAMVQRKQIIIFDEAQHGLERKGAVIEYLRRICDQADTMLVLICHTSERHRFAEQKMAHIATRISARVTFTPATIDDVAIYLHELCEIEVDDRCVAAAFKQSGGRYRLLYSCGRTLEERAKMLGKTSLTGDDIKDIMLCEDTFKRDK